ncbi:element excision factor XisH family protein [Roseofilum sp. BLCC_M91]|uniref:Element excision factor XisH family protein n=1 Tax=Roseofilum halophilum BLCC-M91 TaxID=3022259 RepID=A0ABT7BGB2_9CYAN|nr:element excision factor XisH family protein [Roseofilum halophilum BLCC-M91]
MPSRDAIHAQVKAALQQEGWRITDDPYVYLLWGAIFVCRLRNNWTVYRSRARQLPHCH